jgi:type IV pilus assembly protein PilB
LPHRHLPLAQLLLQARLVTQETLDALEASQRSDDRRLGSLLIEKRMISAARLAQVLSHQLSLPWVSLEKVDFQRDLLQLIPKRIAYRHHVIPVYLRGRGDARTLYVATDDPTREEAIEACREASGMKVRPMVAAPNEVRIAIETHYGRKSSAVMPAARISVVGSPGLGPPPPPPPRPAVSVPAVGVVELDDLDLADEDDEELPDEPPASPPPPTIEVEELVSSPPPRPAVILLVNPPPALVDACRAIAANLPATVESVSLEAANLRALATEPIVIVVTDDVYEFDRIAFNQLAMAVHAPLVVWSEDLASDYLEPVLATAYQRVAAPAR